MRTRPARISCSPRSILALNSSVNSRLSSSMFSSQSRSDSCSVFDNRFTSSSILSSVCMVQLNAFHPPLQPSSPTFRVRIISAVQGMKTWLLCVEADALGQGKLGGIIDGHGLAAHVVFPGAAAAFPAAASFLSPAEGAADFRAAGPDVDVGYAAVAPALRQEQFGFAQIVGENRRTQALRHSVVPGDGFLQFCVWSQI